MAKFPYYEPFSAQKKFLSAIIICHVAGRVEAKKYRNIPDGKEAEFIKDVAVKFPGASHVNFYYKRLPHQSKGEFKHRIYI